MDLLTDLKSLQDQRKFVCGVCSEVYRSLARIVYHVGRCRAGPYHCELCNDVAASRHLLNRHKKKHHKYANILSLTVKDTLLVHTVCKSVFLLPGALTEYYRTSPTRNVGAYKLRVVYSLPPATVDGTVPHKIFPLISLSRK